MATPTLLTGEAAIPDFSEVTVFVGEPKKKFTLHKCFIKSSAFLKAAFGGPWKESRTKTIHLPETDPQTFSVYVQWLYTGEVAVQDCASRWTSSRLNDDKEKQEREEAKFETVQTHYSKCFELAVIADQLDDQRLRNKIIDITLALMDESKMLPHLEHVSAIWDELPENSRLRKLLIDLFTAPVKTGSPIRCQTPLPLEVGFDLGVAAMIRRKKNSMVGATFKGPTYADRCKYHEHDKGEAACGSMEPPPPLPRLPKSQELVDREIVSKAERFRRNRNDILQQIRVKTEELERRDAEELERSWAGKLEKMKLDDGAEET